MQTASAGRGRTIAWLLLVATSVAVLFIVVPPAAGAPTAEAADQDQADAATLDQGSQVYSSTCSSCHQPNGTGLPGQFPPLVDNPNIDDAVYIASTITDGLSGPIEVNGVSYDGTMPPFSTLTDDEIDAVIAYIQSGFRTPEAAQEASADGGSTAGIPGVTGTRVLLGFLLAIGAAVAVFAPRVVGANDRLDVAWPDAWLKAGAIVVAVVLLIVVIPNWALNSSSVSGLSRFWQDAVGSGLFALGFGIVIAGLWFAHRGSRV